MDIVNLILEWRHIVSAFLSFPFQKGGNSGFCYKGYKVLIFLFYDSPKDRIFYWGDFILS